MDLPGVERVDHPACRADLPDLTGAGLGAAWLAGGTWLFSEPQPGLRRLVDLAGLGWPALEISDAGLRIAATCTIAALEAFEAPAAWHAAPLFTGSCRALLGSFKVWEMATVGGNICLSLPAAPMLALTVALDGVAEIWRPNGPEYGPEYGPEHATERRVPMAAFTTGPQQTVLAPGELLRAIDLPLASLQRRAALRQASLHVHGRSAALLVGTSGPGFTLTITASTGHPVKLTWPAWPDEPAVQHAIRTLPSTIWFDDVHGTPAWRRHMTIRLASEIWSELHA